MPFYHKLVLSDESSTTKLYSTGKGGKLIEIGRCPSNSRLSIDTNLSWIEGGDIFSAFREGIMNGAQSALDIIRNISGAAATVGDKVGIENSWKAGQGKLVTATKSYKKYQGSSISPVIPELLFTFVNGDGSNMISDFTRLITPLLPVDTEAFSTGDSNSKNAGDKFAIYQLPPNNFKARYDGFNYDKNLSGYLSVKIGVNKVIKWLVPTNVSIKFSREFQLLSGSSNGNQLYIPNYIQVAVSLTPTAKYMRKHLNNIINLGR